ncbi:MAG: YkvA family protein [Spirochaetaceae bacterium]
MLKGVRFCFILLVKRFPKLLILFTLAYALSPIDLIPDFILVLGLLDDLIILPTLITLSIKSIPKDLLEESKKKAFLEPVSLKKNWFFAVLFILIWIILITALVLSIVKYIT